MYCKDLIAFPSLTPEEQLEDIKEFWYNYDVEDVDGLLDGLSERLYSSSTSSAELAVHLAHTNTALQRGTANDILTPAQKQCLEKKKYAIIGVMRSQWKVFEFWCRMCGFNYTVVAKHKIDAQEYKIWKEEE